MFPIDVATAERAGRVFVLDGHADGESVAVFDARTGRFLRSTTVSTGIQSGGIAALTVDERTGHVFVTSPNNDSVDMLDARSGTIVATSLVARFPSAVAVDARRAHVFVAGNMGVIMLDARSDAVLRTIPLGAAPAAIAVDERTDRVFVVDSFTDAFNTAVGISGISVLDARSGAVLGTTPVAQDPDVTAIALDARRGRVFVSSQGIMDPTQPTAFQGNGTVYELDAHTGRLLRTLRVGVGPVALDVDEQTGHVVVLNSGGAVRVAGLLDGAPAWLRQCLSWLPSAEARTRAVAGSVSVLDPSR